MLRRTPTAALAILLLLGCAMPADGAEAPSPDDLVAATPTTPTTAPAAATPAATDATPARTASSDGDAPPATPQVPVPQEALDAPEAVAARDFITAIVDRDFATAWERLGPVSREVAGSQDALERDASALAEGWGAWVDAPDAEIFRSAVLEETEQGQLSIVVFTGMVSQEGTTEHRTVAAQGWREGDGDAPTAGRFEPFALGGVHETVRITDPVESGTVECEDITVAAEIPDGYDRSFATLDAGEAFTPTYDTGASAPGTMVFTLAGPLARGEHVLTLAFTLEDGRTSADAVRFTVEPC